MKYIFTILVVSNFLICMVSGCRPAREINKVIAPKDTVSAQFNKSRNDSIAMTQSILRDFKARYINFNTFSAKLKVDVETSKEKVPDLTAIIRIQRDKAIWMSISATFLNIEVYRVLITPDSVILQNKKDREVQYRSLDYLQEVTNIPFDFKTIQDLLIGNPIFYTDSIQSLKFQGDHILLSSVGSFFKHLLTLTTNTKLLIHSKLDDVDLTRNRTADISYSEYENINNMMFPTNRHVIIAEKNKIDMRLKYRQVEFNKELSMTFNVPKNYTRK